MSLFRLILPSQLTSYISDTDAIFSLNSPTTYALLRNPLVVKGGRV